MLIFLFPPWISYLSFITATNLIPLFIQFLPWNMKYAFKDEGAQCALPTDKHNVIFFFFTKCKLHFKSTRKIAMAYILFSSILDLYLID